MNRISIIDLSIVLGIGLSACCGVNAGPIEAPPSWVKPDALRRGDTIALVAPSGPVDPKAVRAYREQLEGQGYRVVVSEEIDARRGYLAGSDARRAEELNTAIRNPEVDAIFPIRGGYGLSRILDRIDYRAVRRHPKVLIGFSDTTALHLAVARRSRMVTFHSPAPQGNLYRDEPRYRSSRDLFRRMVLDGEVRSGPVPVPDDGPKPVTLVGGTARGRLTGGNLSLIAATMGTPYAIEPEGAILLIEDVNEAPYRVDRMLAQLRLAGVLESVNGVVAGQFTETGSDLGAVEAVLREYLGSLDKPVLLNYPIGHIAANATVPLGVHVELDADTGTIRLLESPFASAETVDRPTR